jgi:hypothetical protein
MRLPRRPTDQALSCSASSGGLPAGGRVPCSCEHHEHRYSRNHGQIGDVEDTRVNRPPAHADEVGDRPVVEEAIEPVGEAATQNEAKPDGKRHGGSTDSQEMSAQPENEKRNDSEEQNLSKVLREARAEAEKGSRVRGELQPNRIVCDRNTASPGERRYGDLFGRVITSRRAKKYREEH